MRVTIYPNMPVSDGKGNPYIKDFISALENNGWVIANKPHKNPLVSLFFKKRNSDVYILHWIENVPDCKYGYLQSMIAILYLFTIKIYRKKVVWFLHNKKPHTRSHYRLKMFLMRMMAKWSDLIITHAKEGEELIARKYPFAAKKTKFLDHPTKNRMMLLSDGKENDTESTAFDLLIWGKLPLINKYPNF